MNFNFGDLIIFGFKGQALSSETRKTIEKYQVSNVILFGPNNPNNNYLSKTQLIELNDDLQATRDSSSEPMIITVDQEGGRVQRFRNEFTLLPSARKIAEKKSPPLAFEMAKIQAKELFAAGIQLNFAPVCDVNTNPSNPVIGDRAYGAEEKIVSEMVESVVRAHLDERVQPCIKHFPGHGDTHTDSHFALPTVDTSLETLRRREWIPFQRAMQSGCSFLMSAHILLPQLDPDRPGTLSKTFLKKYLRDELNYQGVVISDDMQMQAITDHYGAEEAPILALEAGCDLLCYRTEDASIIAMEAIKKAVVDKRLSISVLNACVERVRKIRKKIILSKDTMSKKQRLEIIGHSTHLAFAEQFR